MFNPTGMYLISTWINFSVSKNVQPVRDHEQKI